MDFFDLIASRYSCRRYLDRPVEREKLLQCVEASRLAPSSCNSQPWKFIIVQKPESIAELGEALADPVLGFNSFARTCPAIIAVVKEKPRNLFPAGCGNCR